MKTIRTLLLTGLAATFTLLAGPLHGQVTQQWATRYNGPANGTDYAHATAVDAAGNVVVTGQSRNASGNDDYYTAKYAAGTGALLWEKRYNGTGNSTDIAHSVAVDASGNVVVTGQSVGSGSNYDYYTAKYAAADGALLWEKRYNGTGNSTDIANSVAVDAAGNVVVTGQSHGVGVVADYYTAKYAAADGALLWEKRYNGPANSNDTAYSVAVDASGNVVVTGSSYNGSVNQDYYTAKYAAATGALLWEKRYNGTDNGDDRAYSVAVDASGNVVVTGYSFDASGTNSDYYTAKYAAATGALLWEKRYNGTGNSNDTAYSVAVDAAGNVAVTGQSIGSGTGFDYYTAKYAAADGALLWEQRYNGPGNNTDFATSVAVDAAGNVAVTGQSTGSDTGYDYYTAKYAAADGALLWEQRYDGPANSADVMSFILPYTGKLALTPDGGAVVTGQSFGSGTSYDYATVKYGPPADTTAPTLVDLTMQAPGGGIPPHVTTGTTVTLNLTADEAIAAPTVTMAGRAATVSGSGTTWQATITVLAEDPQGPVAFQVAFADVAGNAGTPVTVLPSGSPVVIDTIAPVAAAPVLSPVSDTGASDSDGITQETRLRFTGTVELEDQVYLYDGEQIVAFYGAMFQTDYTLQAIVAEGTHTFTVRVIDQAGNASASSPATVVTVDTTPPQAQPVFIRSSNFVNPAYAGPGQFVEVFFSMNEASAPPSVTLLGVPALAINVFENTWRALVPIFPGQTEGPAAFSIAATDLAGNSAVIDATTDGSSVTVDPTPPVITVPENITVPAIGPDGGPAWFDVSAFDAGFGPVTATPSRESGSTFPIGTTTVDVTATDVVGNSANASFTVTVTAPRLRIERAGSVVESGVTHDVGIASVNRGTMMTFDLTNSGTSELYLDTLQIDGADRDAFMRIQFPMGYLAAGQSAQLTVLFLPRSHGVKSATLTIASTDPTSPFTIPVTGSGVTFMDHFIGNSGDVPRGWWNYGFDNTVLAPVVESGTVATITDAHGGAGPNLMMSPDFGGLLDFTATFHIGAVTAAAGTEPVAVTGIGDFWSNLLMVEFNTVTKRFSATVLQNEGSETFTYTLPAGVHLPSYAGGSLQYSIVGGATGFHITSPLNSFDSGEIAYASAVDTDPGHSPAHVLAGFNRTRDLSDYPTIILGTDCSGTAADGTLCSIAYDQVLVDGTPVPIVPELVLEQPEGTPLSNGTATVDFGAAPVGVLNKDGMMTFTLRNAGNTALVVTSIAATGGDAGDFSVSASGFRSATPAGTVTTLGSGESGTFTVQFIPTAAGPRATTLRIVSDDPANGVFDVVLTGTGGGGQELVVEDPNGTSLANGASFAFSPVTFGSSSAAKTFTLRNIGTSALAITSVTTTGGNAGDFAVDTTGTLANVPAGSSTTFRVTFTPSTALSRATTLRIVNDDGDEATFDVTLSGDGTKAAATVTLGNLSQVYNGTPRSATATTAPGAYPVTISYNGSTTAPTNIGSYSVVATIDDANYQGSASGTLVIEIPFDTSNVTTASSSIVGGGDTATVSTAPTSAGSAGVTATVVNGGTTAPIQVIVANYASTPSGVLAFQAGTTYVDIQVAGADSSDSLSARFYYPSSVTGSTESNMKLKYWDGVRWSNVRSTGNSEPGKSTTDNLDGTVSGGRFTAVLDATSTPKLTELSGTVFALAPVVLDIVNDGAFAGSSSVLIDVLGNDTTTSGTLALVSVTPPVSGGTAVMEAGKVRFTRVGAAGAPVTFTYTAGNGSESATATVTVKSISGSAGSYIGLLRRADGKVRGRVTATVTSTGLVTGTVRREGTSFSYKGSLLGAMSGATSTVMLPSPLRLVPGADGPTGQPTLAVSLPDTAGVQMLRGNAERAPYSATNPAPQAGRYTIVANRPTGGSGPAVGAALTCVVTSQGVVTIGGKLGNGVMAAQSGRLLDGGRYPFYVSSGGGALMQNMAGEPVFHQSLVPAVSGALRWTVPNGADARLSGGLAQDYDAYGLIYTPGFNAAAMFNPSTPSALLTLPIPSFRAAPIVTSLNLTGTPYKGVQTVYFAPGVGKVLLSPGSGFFSGTRYASKYEYRTFFGVVQQGSVNAGKGIVLDVTSLQQVTLAP